MSISSATTTFFLSIFCVAVVQVLGVFAGSRSADPFVDTGSIDCSLLNGCGCDMPLASSKGSSNETRLATACLELRRCCPTEITEFVAATKFAANAKLHNWSLG